MRARSASSVARCAVLLVTGEEAVQRDAEQRLSPAFTITHVLSTVEGTRSLGSAQFAAVALDLETSARTQEAALDWIAAIRRDHPQIAIVGMSRSPSQSLERRVLSCGADGFVSAPVDFRSVRNFLARAIEDRRLEAELNLRRNLVQCSTFCGLIGSSEPMQRVYETIRRVAKSPITVVIRGESGTGKELVARAIVASSPRSDKPFVSLNCAALPESLIESELFGHERGAFTGAIASKPGQIELAHTGTLFLDEISSLDLGLQGKLLRALEEHTVQRIGGKSPHKVDFRLITATNDDLEELVRTGRFREDLYYRIHVVPVYLPGLRERTEDIPLLVDHFLRAFAGDNGSGAKRMSAEAMEILEDYSWPGNVRELENLIQRLAIMVDGPMIHPTHLPHQILYSTTAKQQALLIPEEGINFYDEIARIEGAYLQAALRRTQGKKRMAAALLKLKPQQMKYLCRKHHVR